jgi:hypothetical protein
MGTWLRHFAFVVFTLAALGGCGEGYRVEPAILNVIGITDESKDQLLTVVSRFLKQEGFEDLGRDSAMISLIKQGPMPEKAGLLAKLNRERTFLNEASHLRIVWADYSNGELPTGAWSLRYTPSSSRFIETSIIEERPGGFSPNGQHFYGRFLSNLREQYGTSVLVVKEPPPTDEAEYRRVTVVNTIAIIVWCSIALLVPLLLTGSLSVHFLRKLPFSNMTRRIIFVLVNSWLVAPLPFPAAWIMVIPAPNLFAFPWTNLDYYHRVAPYAAVSFPCTLVVCAAVSLFLFKRPSEGERGQA